MYVKKLAALALVSTLAACAGTPEAGYVHADKDDRAAVARGEYNVNATAVIAIVQNPDKNGGLISIKALKKIEEYAISCDDQISPQAAGPGQSGLIGGVSGLVTGAGEGPAAGLAFTGASVARYSTFGGIAYILPDVKSGLDSGAFSQASAKGTCTRDFWEDIVKDDPVFAGTHVEVLTAGKSWGDSRPPAAIPQLDHAAVWSGETQVISGKH